MIKYIILLVLFVAGMFSQTVDESMLKNSTSINPANTQFTLVAGTHFTGNLSIAGANSITINSPYKCPFGVAGSDSNHYIRVYDGTGTAESVLITGGSCTSGGTGTLYFTTANTHTGAFKLGSATAGIDEALRINKRVVLPCSTLDVYATITPPTGSVITGCGSNVYTTAGTTLRFNSTNTKFFNLINDNIFIRDVHLLQVGTALTGNYGIYTAGSGSGIAGAIYNWGKLEKISLDGFYYGIYIDGCGGQCSLETVSVKNSRSTGVVGLGAQGRWQDVLSQFNGTKQTTPADVKDHGHGFYLGNCTLGTGVCGTSPLSSGLHTFGNYGWGFYVGPSSGITISGSRSFFNYDRSGEVYCGTGCSGNFANASIEYAGWDPGGTFTTNTTAVGLHIATGAGNLSVSELIVDQSQGNNILVESPTKFSNIDSFMAGVGGVAGNKYAFKASGANNISLEQSYFYPDNNYSGAVLITGASLAKLTNNAFYGGTAAIPSLEITGNSAGVVLNGNDITNGVGGTAIECDAGSTLREGSNYLAGTITNNCTREGSDYTNTGSCTFAQLAGAPAGTTCFCTNCTIPSNPCTLAGGATDGAWAVSNGAKWICK